MGDAPSPQVSRSADISQSAYAVKARQLLDVIDQIRDNGGQSLNLPRIVVIGNQSAGKSSLIEAIARINVPRGGGTCTRCPTEIRLRRSEQEWKCSISLRYEYADDGERIPDPVNLPFGGDIHDPTQVEGMLRRAQVAVLNNARDLNWYLETDVGAMPIPGDHKQFSKNIICLEVSGPLLTDLTFVDLPGIIQHHPTDSSLVDLIKSMVKEYINDSSSLILCTITMKGAYNDPENQAALSEAKAADPEGKRTIGVLTKPDTLQTSDESQWVNVLSNRGQHRLALGYYITKQPTQLEVEQGITFDTARENENQFFRDTDVWRNLPDPIRANVGTFRLTAALSDLLSGRIRSVLPQISQRLQTSLRRVDEDISSLSSTVSSNPVADVINLCNRFHTRLDGFVKGSEDSEKLVQNNNVAFSKFRDAIHDTAPLFLPYTDSATEFLPRHAYEEPIEILHERVEYPHVHNMYRLNEVRDVIQKAKTRELPFNVPYRVKTRLMSSPTTQWKNLAERCFAAVGPHAHSVVESIVQDIFGRNDRTLLLSFIQELVRNKFAELEKDTHAALSLLSNMEAQGAYTQNQYYQTMRETLITHYRAVRAQERIRARPSAKPSAVSTASRETVSSSKLEAESVTVDSSAQPRCTPSAASSPAIRSILKNATSSSHCSQTVSVTESCYSTQAKVIISHLEEIGIAGVKEDDLLKLVPHEDWEEEIIVMAEVRAYFQVAYKRFIDVIPLAIDQVFVRPLADSMHEAIIKGLDFDSPDARERCKAYLAESPEKAERRQRLYADRDRLEKAQEALKTIGFGQ